MATHSSIIAWRIPVDRGLPPMGSQSWTQLSNQAHSSSTQEEIIVPTSWAVLGTTLLLHVRHVKEHYTHSTCSV